MSSKKAKWKESFQKTKSLSQTSLSLSSSRKTSIADEETSAKELEQYLETLNRKSGLKGLWSGSSFDKVIRDEEDKTPDISISSGEDDGPEDMLQSEDGMDSDDFRPNIMMLSNPPSLTSEDNSGVNPMQGIQMVEFALSGDEISENQFNNSNISNTLKSLSLDEKNVKSINNDLSQDGEIVTEDEVEEEIAEEVIHESVMSESSASDGKSKSKRNRSYHSRTEKTDSHNSNKGIFSKTAENSHSYTEDFSVASNQTISERSISHSTDSHTSRSSRKSDSRHGSRSSRSSRSYSSRSRSYSSYSSKSHSSWSSQSSKSRSHREQKSKKSSKHNSYTHDVGVQTNMAADTFVPTVPPGLAVGMATSGPRLGMDYVDPSPIATHVVAAEAMEAMTAYNPAVVALNDMLRQQIKLVEQFTDSNRRMYEAYTRNLNSSYKYTTLEDTMEFIRKHRPKTITMEEALERVKQEDGR